MLPVWVIRCHKIAKFMAQIMYRFGSEQEGYDEMAERMVELAKKQPGDVVALH